MKTDTTICLNSKVNGKQPSLQDRIYDTGGVATAITTCFLPLIAIPYEEDRCDNSGDEGEESR